MPSASRTGAGLFDSSDTLPNSAARRRAATLPSIRVIASDLA
jgi:hypothetical protein